jgi:hypothetical protein
MNDAIYNNKTNFSADSHSMHFPSSALVGATGDALAAGAWLRRGSILVQVVLVNLAVHMLLLRVLLKQLLHGNYSSFIPLIGFSATFRLSHTVQKSILVANTLFSR